ncbi:hypothetical protein BDA99DRAFT_438748 [Phascolomyces articulosus]|uniref:Uncharacterized protein n=1 Tax=Phascolomyces articulosus TaxID=60185 RepID=A0AAD5PDV8_9FUNG|nr:hypothetical protein BDA99DRAFT_438748 [Phascolomyces articulosus]
MFGVLASANSVPPIEPECQTPTCMQSAKLIKEYIDFNADPCDDFYQYSFTGTWQTIMDENNEVLRTTYEGTFDDFIGNIDLDTLSDFHVSDQEQIDRQNFEKIQSYYKQCMDVNAIDAQGSAPVLPLISKVLGPLSEKFDPETLTTAVIEMTMQSVRTLFNTVVEQDDMQPEVYAFKLMQPDLSIPKEYYSNPDALKIYRESLVNLLNVVFGTAADDDTPEMANVRSQKLQEANLKPLSNEEISATVDRFIETEKYISSLSQDLGELHNPIKFYKRISVTEIQEKYPFINWERFFKSLTDGATPIPDYVVFSFAKYFDNINAWLSSAFTPSGKTPSSSPSLTTPQSQIQSLKDFFMIKIIIRWVYALDSKTREAWQPMKVFSLMGSHEEPPRNELCIKYAGDAMGMLQGRYYTMRKFGGEKERTGLKSMIKDIQDTLFEIVKGTKWFDQPTIDAALEKANKIVIEAAYSIDSPDERDPQNLQKYYEPLTISKASFLETETSATAWKINNKAKEKIGHPVSADVWRMNPSMTNAFYDGMTNRIVILAGLSNAPLYVPDNPIYLKYSSLGYVIAHELTHAFDSNGRYRDSNGKLFQWWSPETAKYYDELAQCFIKQFGNFTFMGPDNKEMHLNGQLTLSENIADTGGLVAAYKAFNKLWNGHGKLPGLDLSPEELFFVNFGMTWCSRRQPESALASAYTNGHSLEKFRINGPLQNFPQFAKTFQCPIGSPMNPEKKCSLWT